MINWRQLLSIVCTAAVLAATFVTPAIAGPAPATQPSVATAPRQDAAVTDDWARVKAAGKLVVGTAADYPPFEFYNSNYELDGFDIALMQELGKRLGITIEFNDFAFNGLLDALRLGQVDTAISAISVTPDRQEVVDFTNLYYIGEDAALVKGTSADTFASVTDLAGKKIGVERGTTYQSWVQQNAVDTGLIPQEDLLTYDDVNAMVRDLRNGTIDVALMGLIVAQQETILFKDLKIGGQNFNKQQFAIAARKGSTLIEQLNQALVETQADGTFANLVRQYLQATPGEVTPDNDTAQIDNTPVVTETVPSDANGKLPAAPVAPPCINGMGFVADLNLDDQNMTAPPVMQLGQDFVKSWRIKNTGTCAWDPNFQMAYVNGNRAESPMSGQPTAIGRVVAPGEMADVSVSLRAPQSYGTFQGFWQLRDTAGQYFGEVVWVGIQVPDPNPPAPVAPAIPPPPPPPPSNDTINPNLRADLNYVNPGQCTTIRWDVDNVNGVYFIDGSNVQGVSGHDARTVCPGGTFTYVLRVVRLDNGQVDFPITITVGGGGNAPYTINFWTDSDNIQRGQCTTLRWDVQGVREVYLNDEGVPGVSAREVCPSDSKTYRLRVVLNNGGQDQREVRIQVSGGGGGGGGGPRIEKWTTDENEIRAGKCLELRWRASDVGTIRIYRNGELIKETSGGEGKHKDCPPGPGLYEYRLDASGHTGQSSQSLTVNVTP